MAIKYPRAYAESTLMRMCKKLDMPKEDIKLLEDYFTAISNFYEILPLSDVFEVIELLDKGLVTKQKFLEFAEMKRHTPDLEYCILGKESFFAGAEKSGEMERELIHVSVIEVDEFFYHELKGRQYGIPLYIPPKNQLLCYVKEEYYEHNRFTNELKDYLITRLFMSDTEAEDFILDAYMHIRVCAEPEGAFELWTEFLEKRPGDTQEQGLTVDDAQYEQLATLFYDMYDNTRLPCYRGYTYNERFGKNEEKSDDDDEAEEFFGYDYLPRDGASGNIAGFPYSGSLGGFSEGYVDSKVSKSKK